MFDLKIMNYDCYLLLWLVNRFDFESKILIISEGNIIIIIDEMVGWVIGLFWGDETWELFIVKVSDKEYKKWKVYYGN